MRRPIARKLAVALTASALTLLAFACGSRTGLLGEGPIEDDEQDSSTDDPIRRLDAKVRDVQEPLPGLDAKPDVIVDQRDCKDPTETVIYVMTEGGDLYAFNPRDFSFRLIGPILCPSSGTPFSMAVDRQGVAYVVFNNGDLFRVSTRNAACAATPFQSGQQGVFTFGMGFTSDTGGAAETLFIASSGDTLGDFDPTELGRIGLPSFELDVTGEVTPTALAAELTGTGDGRLFGFYYKDNREETFIGQIDKQTATIVAETPLPGVHLEAGWAFAFWGGDFYTFSGDSDQDPTAHVRRVRPSDGTIVDVAALDQKIVGAGVSTCSPVE
jgi:hypothetical protein